MATSFDATILKSQAERLISERQGLEHLRPRIHGALLYLESGPEDDPYRHVKFKRDTVHLWTLEMPRRGGRWDKTPFRDTLDNLFELVATTFPWVLAPVYGNSEWNSDPED